MSDVMALIASAEKQYNKKVAWHGAPTQTYSRISTGSFALDAASGGGVPTGKITVFYGTESSFKTGILLKIIADAQKKWPEKKAVFIDVEGHFDAEWAAQLGVDVPNLGYVIPDNAEQVVDLAESFLYAEDLSVLGVDSLAALVTNYELEESAEKAIVGKTGIAINKFYRKSGAALGRARQEGRSPTLICINQVRANIGAMYGPSETMVGGRAFKFGASMIIRLYGKDENDTSISKTLPAFKAISATIEKWKVPILQKSTKFSFALLKNEKLALEPGQADNWAPVLHYLKHLNLLVKGDSGGWDLVDTDTGETSNYKTQLELKEHFISDYDLASKIQSQVITQLRLQGGIIEAQK